MNKIKEKSIIVIGSVAADAALQLLTDRNDELAARYPGRYLEDARAVLKTGIVNEKRLRGILGKDSDMLVDCREKGIFGALWKLGELQDLGLYIEQANIPVSQPAIEICDYFGINPYEIPSKGCFVLAVDEMGTFIRKMNESGTEAAVIGFTTPEKARLIVGSTRRYLTRIE